MRSMRFLTVVRLLPVTTLLAVSLGLSFEYNEVKPKYISRRAIDGTRGRKYFNPQEDGFLDDYGYNKGQYLGTREVHDLSDIRSNVPGEPGVDYPAYLNIPRTMFSCISRKRGYYADEDAGCQVFHVCDDNLVSSFLCPVGSLFSQRLLTCDWWSRVSCTESHKFYNQQSHSADTLLTDSNMLRHALSETMDYQKVEAAMGKKKEKGRTDLTSMSARRHENQLESNNVVGKNQLEADHRDNRLQDLKNSNGTITKSRKDLSLLKIKSLIEERRRSKNRGHSRLAISSQNQLKPKLQEKDFKYFTSTLPTLSTTQNDDLITTTVEPIYSQEKNFNYETTTRPFKSFTQQYENTTSINSLSNVSVKANLETKAMKNAQNLSQHNVDYEYDEMEGRESIDFINSHAERSFEKEENKVKVSRTPIANNHYNNSRISIIFNNTASIQNVLPKRINRPLEQIETKESIGIVQYNVPRQLESYDKQKFRLTDNLPKESDERIRKIKNSVEEKITDLPFQYETEASTLLYSNTETSTFVTNFDGYANDENKDTFQITESREAVRSPKFQITVRNNETFDFAGIPLIPANPINYKYPLNSTEIPFANTILPVTNSTLEQTTLTSYAKQFADTIQESNSPLQVTFPLSNNKNLTNIDLRTPIELEILSRLISQHEDQPINFEDLEIVKSDQINHGMKINADQHITDSTQLNGKTLRNFKMNIMEQDDGRVFTDYSPQLAIIDALKASKNPFNLLQNENKNFKIHRPLPQNFRNQQYDSVVSTQSSQQSHKYYPIYQKVPRGFQNIEANQERLGHLKNSNIQDFLLPMSDATHFAYPKEPIYSNTYLNEQRPVFSSTYADHTNGNGYNQNKGETDDGSYGVNYRMPQNPENLADYKQTPQQNYKYHSDNNYRNPDTFQNYKNYRSSENHENSKNDNKEKIISDYGHYQNYKNAEEVLETPHFVDFGARIVKKNHNANVSKAVDNKPKIAHKLNKYKVNSDIQGKGVNFLWTMSQLAGNDRLPRPLVPNNTFFTQNSNNNHANAYNTSGSVGKINYPGIDNFKEISRNNNINSNNGDYYYDNFKVNASDSMYNNGNINENSVRNFAGAQRNADAENFAASKFERLPFLNKISKTVNNAPPVLLFDNRETFNEAGEESYGITHSVAENPHKILPNFQSHIGTHNMKKAPELNMLGLNDNQRFSPISQSNLNDFKPENLPLSNGHSMLLNNPQLQLINNNLYKNAQTSFENVQLADKNLQINPEALDYNFELTTQQTIKNSQTMQDIQYERKDYPFQPTILTTAADIPYQNFASDNMKYNDSEPAITQKSLVETEFIPSISFDFGSDEGMQEYLEALRKGLVTNDNDFTTVYQQTNFSTNTDTQTNEKIRSKRCKNSKIINNFKDSDKTINKTK